MMRTKMMMNQDDQGYDNNGNEGQWDSSVQTSLMCANGQIELLHHTLNP